MSRNNKRSEKRKPKYWETATNKHYFVIYDDLLESDAFRTLTARQKDLYLKCVSLYKNARIPKQDYPNLEWITGENEFYISKATVLKCGLYPASSVSNLYKDMDALEEHGLVKKLSSGMAQHKKSIYSFSDEWKEYRKP